MLLVRFCLIHGKKNLFGVAMGNGARGSKVPFSPNCASPGALLRSRGRVSVVVSVSRTAACVLHARESRSDRKFDKMPHACDVAGCPNGARRRAVKAGNVGHGSSDV